MLKQKPQGRKRTPIKAGIHQKKGELVDAVIEPLPTRQDVVSRYLKETHS